MKKLQNYVSGSWIEGDGEGQLLRSALDGSEIATASSQGLDFGQMLEYARRSGGSALRKMSFQERGRMLKALALFLT